MTLAVAVFFSTKAGSFHRIRRLCSVWWWLEVVCISLRQLFVRKDLQFLGYGKSRPFGETVGLLGGGGIKLMFDIPIGTSHEIYNQNNKPAALTCLGVSIIIFFSSIMTSKKENSEPRYLKTTTPLEIASNLIKTQHNRQRLLKQLQQLGLDLTPYETLTLPQLIHSTDALIRNTYSVKYLGLNKNEMGIISRRINPLSDQNFKVHQAVQQSYTVHKYFYPKPLKTGKKVHVAETINVNNLQSEIKRQFDEHRNQKLRQQKQNKDDKLRTKVAGSWYSLSKTPSQCSLLDRPPKLNPNTLANNIVPKIDPTQSFSRFLNKGILIVRD